MNFQQFFAKWTNPSGQRVDFDHVYKYQCLDLILQGLYEMDGINGAYGNAIDYWNHTDAKILTKYDRIASTDVLPGDIVVLKTAGYYGIPERDPGDGHIAWATGNQNGTQLEILEQNGGNGAGDGIGINAIRTRWVYKNRIAGLLRRHPVPVVPTVPMINADQLVQLYQQFLNRAPDPGAYDHYVGHYTYDFVATDLRNSAEYAAGHAPQPVPPPAPAVPDGQLEVKMAEKIKLDFDVPYYDSAAAAQVRRLSLGTAAAGAYLVYTSQLGMKEITKDYTVPTNKWINPAENVPPEPSPAPPVVPSVKLDQVPTDWQKTLRMFTAGTTHYKALDDMTIIDLAAKDPVGIRVKSGEWIPMQGTFIKNNIIYLFCRLTSDTAKERYYGVPTEDIASGAPTMVSELYENTPQASLDNREYRRQQGHLTTADRIADAQKLIAQAVTDGYRFIDGIIPLSKLRERIKK